MTLAHAFPLTLMVWGDAYKIAWANWTQLTIFLANIGRFACSPMGLWMLSMASCADKAMDTFGSLCSGI